MKKRIGFFDFTGCEGCQLTVLNLEGTLLEVLEVVDIVAFREVMPDRGLPLDIAFVEGSVCRDEEMARLQGIRERSTTLVALGACADTGGINALRQGAPAEACHRVYGSSPSHLLTGDAHPLSDVVEVDARVPGCPVDGREFLSVLQALLLGRPNEPPPHALCVDCKLAELPCTFERGIVCLGPITRGGCGAVCIDGGDRCRGCRGFVDNPRSEPYYRILEESGLTPEDVLDELRIFNVHRKETP